MTPEQWVERWSPLLIDGSHIPTWTEPASLAYCMEVASRGRVGVEIGTYMGASAYHMLSANTSLHLWCVDKFEVFGTKKVTEYFCERFILNGRCELIVGDSLRGSEMLQHMAGKLDFVWVDDGHATHEVMQDIRCFLPLLRSGGEIFGHDFDVPHNDVALGVIASLPMDRVTFPVPRVWSYIKP